MKNLTKKILSGLSAIVLTGSAMLCHAPGQFRYAPVPSALTVCAEDLPEKVFEDLEYIAYPDHVKITGYEGEKKSLTIPAEIEGLPVTEIGVMAFSMADSLVFITLPDTLTSIGAGAFYMCENLREIVIPDHVTQIEDYAFLYCLALEEVVIPESVISFGGCVFLETPWLARKRQKDPLVIVNHIVVDAQTCCGTVNIPEDVVYVTDYTFYGSDAVSVTIPEGVPAIGNSVFSECNNLESVSVPDSVTRIGEKAFGNCSKLTDITIPDGVTSIGECAFGQCTSLSRINVPASVTEMGDRIFALCTSLHDVTLQEGLESIGREMFSGCDSLERIIIPAVVIGIDAFSGCENLKQVELTQNVTQIDKCAFRFTGIEEITIPETVTVIGERAFGKCPRLRKIVIENPDCEIDDSVETIFNKSIMDKETWTTTYHFKGMIYGYAGSTAQAYAEKYNLNFQNLNAVYAVPGDMDGDGENSVLDVIILQKYLLGSRPLSKSAWEYADLNQDGVVNIYDLLILKQNLLKK